MSRGDNRRCDYQPHRGLRQAGRAHVEGRAVNNVLDDLEWRGLVANSTDRDALRAALDEGSVRV